MSNENGNALAVRLEDRRARRLGALAALALAALVLTYAACLRTARADDPLELALARICVGEA